MNADALAILAILCIREGNYVFVRARSVALYILTVNNDDDDDDDSENRKSFSLPTPVWEKNTDVCKRVY